MPNQASRAGRRPLWDDDEPRVADPRRPRAGASTSAFAQYEDPHLPDLAHDDRPEVGDRWSAWGNTGIQHGPEPWPDWIITENAAVEIELGVLKTGKEADVHLIERMIPGTDRSCQLAAKRYRSSEHRMFHRDAGYLEGRRVRRSRTTRAMANRTAFGREVIAGQWAAAEFGALTLLWQLGQESGRLRVPYPVQLDGTELLLEFVAQPDGSAAPRLAQLRPGPDELESLWQQTVDALGVLARAGLAHGDLSPYNVLVQDPVHEGGRGGQPAGQLVLIDLPQVVDVVANPQGPKLLARDVTVMSTWFAARGLPVEFLDPEALIDELLADAGVR